MLALRTGDTKWLCKTASTLLMGLVLTLGTPVSTSAAITVTAVGGNNQHRTDLANILTAVTGTQVTIAANGVMSIANGGNACAAFLRDAINAGQAVTLNVGRNLDGVAVGQFHGTNGTSGTKSTGTQDIDLDDVDKYGDDNSAGDHTRGALLMHEIWEVVISLRDQIPFDDFVDAQGKPQDGAHKKAIKDCENGYYSAMTPPVMFPTERICGEEVVRDLGNGDFKVYVHFKSGGGSQTEGWSCNPVHINGTKIQVTGPPTFTPGAQPPGNGPFSLGESGFSLLGAGPGPLEGFSCNSVSPASVPAMSAWGMLVTLLVLSAAGLRMLRKRIAT